MTTTITSHLDELIEQERRRASERITQLKRAAAAEQRRIDAKVIDLLREQDLDLYDRLSGEARNALAAEKAKRSSRAKKAAAPSGAVAGVPASRGGDPDVEEAAPWNG